MSEQQTDKPQWAVVELMGHARTGGIISKDTQFGTPLLRLDVPVGDGEFKTNLINPQSIYRVTFCDETIGRAAAKSDTCAPVCVWEVRQLLEDGAPKQIGSVTHCGSEDIEDQNEME